MFEVKLRIRNKKISVVSDTILEINYYSYYGSCILQIYPRIDLHYLHDNCKCLAAFIKNK